ncbi:hypothetical protein Ddye_011954 [Dipteronia dyeriana]|uniref:Retrotransposon Copia-like N-terminal domain-containing protein n=1 Tax=Dipteronia dyeriana TaxID=168575 RepID=A0AAD9X3E4_9ROSI|nr:hypothetical protein Ddye_011954 [Dipteronia dyeriana]
MSNNNSPTSSLITNPATTPTNPQIMIQTPFEEVSAPENHTLEVTRAHSFRDANFQNPLNSKLVGKLNDSNYIMWKIIVMVVMIGQKLDGHILGIKPYPPQYIVSPVTYQISARATMSWQEGHATLMTFKNILSQLNLIYNGGIDLTNATTNFASHKTSNNNNTNTSNKTQNLNQFKTREEVT